MDLEQDSMSENTDPWDIAPQPTCYFINGVIHHIPDCECEFDGDEE